MSQAVLPDRITFEDGRPVLLAVDVDGKSHVATARIGGRQPICIFTSKIKAEAAATMLTPAGAVPLVLGSVQALADYLATSASTAVIVDWSSHSQCLAFTSTRRLLELAGHRVAAAAA